ncbi:hypothetical protein GQ44DRAFT_720145, partial [Phaeosphaeriaceae sp. PMI808]
PYSLLPHTSHILQPLNVIVFQPYKYHHKKRVEIAIHKGYNNFNYIKEYSILLSRITKLLRAAIAIAAQHKDSRHVQTGGTIYISDARLRTAAKDSIQKKKEERATTRAAAKALKEAEAREASPPTSSNESNPEI